MTFDEILTQVLELLLREKRVSYRALKVRFQLNDDLLAAVKDELIYAKKLAVDEENRVLVWTGDQETSPLPPAIATSERTSAPAIDQAREPLSYTPKHLAEKILTSRSALEGERKQVTVLFCDLANSTPIAERIGPEAMHTLLNRFFEVALNVVHRYEGTINQFLGDGFMALFGAPLAHEDHARRAVLAAWALQRILREADMGKPYGEECQFRMGLNSGLVVVGSIGDNLRMDYSAVGDTTNLAARLQQLAEPGTMLVSESTTRLVQGAVRLEALPPVEVKGKTEPVPIYQVIGTLPRRSPIASRSERTLSPFVGRERELATLEALFTQVESGQGQVVGIVAEAGGGKSRRLHAIGEHTGDRRLQVWGLGVMGWIQSLQGEGKASIAALQQALSLVPDAFESAWVLGLLGYAYLEKGDLAEARATLEQAVVQANQYRSRQVQSWFKTFLSQAYLLDTQSETADMLAHQALALAQDIHNPWGVALARRTLGRIAHIRGKLIEAATHLQEALVLSDAIQARYDMARTHLDLAALAHTQNNQGTATTHLSIALAWFMKLQVPKWVEKTGHLARAYGVTLTEVALETLTEGEV